MSKEDKARLIVDKISYTVPGMGRPVLDKVSLTLNPGDFLIVLGSNGSGKSSLLKCLNGSTAVSTGAIYLDKEDVTEQNGEQIAKTVATLVQSIDQSTYGGLTVEENLRLVTKQAASSLGSFLSRFHPDLLHKLSTPVHRLSGGQRQCLALALCLLREPKLLLLDEHTSALDPKTAKDVMKITDQLHREHSQLSIVMTTHSLDDALSYGNRLLVMRRGEVVFEARGKEKEQLTKRELLEFYE